MKTAEQIMAALKAIADEAETRSLTDEEVKQYEELEVELADVKRSAEIRSRQAAYETSSKPLATASSSKSEDEDVQARAFDQYLRTGSVSPELAEFRAQGEASGSIGGYLVPPGFREQLIEKLLAFGGLATAATTITTATGQSLEWPTVNDTAHVGEIVAEAGTFAAGNDIAFGQGTLGAYKYMAGGGSNLPLKVSWELLQDSAFDLQGYLAKALGTRIARIQSTHWVTGTGSSQPQGLMYAQTSYDEITSNTAGPSYAELVATVHALDPAYRTPGCSWLMNDATLGVIQSIVDDNGRPLWIPQQDSGMTMLGNGTLLGYPVIVDQAVASIGDQAKFLAFGNFAEAYVIRRVKDVVVVVLNELYAANGQVGFFAWARADGVVQDLNAYVVLAGQNT